MATTSIEATPSNDGNYWIVSIKPLEDFTISFTVSKTTTDPPAIRIQRPPRTDEWREQQAWNMQIDREVSYREETSQGNVFDAPNFWSTNMMDITGLHRIENVT